jgi:long-subunit fatty acid transport protein
LSRATMDRGALYAVCAVLRSVPHDVFRGVSYKTPGTIWMAGRAHVAGRGDQATLDFQLPQTLEFGAAYRLTPQLTLVAQSRWVEFSAFEDTELRFARRPFLNQAAVNQARDRFRLGGGLQYVLCPGVTLQVGFSWERWAIKSASLAPTLHDHTEYYLFPAGITIEHGLWQLHVMAGQAYTESRRVKVQQNPFFAGRYSLDQAIFGLQVTRRFGVTEQSEPQL